MSDEMSIAARALLKSEPTLAQLIDFVRTYDPTAQLRASWGERFEPRRDYLLGRAQDMLFLGKEFPGNHAEIVLCMAYCVTTAPYLGVAPAQVQRYLMSLLRELVASPD